MLKDPLVKAQYHFPGISVLVPKQHAGDVVAIDKGSLIPDKINMNTDRFTVIRMIGNIVLVNKADYENGKVNPVTTFDPPVEIRIGYNSFDVMKSNGDHLNLKLAYWDGKGWVIISDGSHEFTILPPSTGQVAEAKLRSWLGDPPLAWGK